MFKNLLDVKPPKNMNYCRKKPPIHQDINMRNGANFFAHAARTPNTNHLERWQKYRLSEEDKVKSVDEGAENEKQRIRQMSQYEIHRTKNQLRDQIKLKVNEKVQAYLDDLEKRRDKLRNLMAEEEQMYVRETIDRAQRADETKFADMKKRSEELRAAKEADRMEIVKQKRIQQYSIRCAELRPFFSRKMTEESKSCQLQQMRENEARRQAEAEITRMYDNLLRKQDEAFLEREVQEALIRYNRCKKDMDVLTMQIRAKKESIRNHQELEKANFMESLRLAAKQSQEERDEMRRKYEKRLQDAEDLRSQIELQRKFMDQRKREEIALDNAFAKLGQMELQREQAKVMDSRSQFAKEIAVYKHHLEHMKIQREREEKELMVIVNDYQRKAQEKHEDAVCKYRESRQKLAEDVMRGRAEQVRENRARAERDLEYQKTENKLMQDIFDTNRRLHEESERIRVMAEQQYRDDLKKQIDYNYAMKKRELEEAERRLHQGMEEERKLEALVKGLIESDLSMEHPFRRIITQYDCKCPENKNKC